MSNKAKMVKSCDYDLSMAVDVFLRLNKGKVELVNLYDSLLPEGARCYNISDQFVIVTDVEPRDLIYPEGWYYAKGCYRNKHQSTTGFYQEVQMRKSDKTSWDSHAKYCTLYD